MLAATCAGARCGCRPYIDTFGGIYRWSAVQIAPLGNQKKKSRRHSRLRSEGFKNDNGGPPDSSERVSILGPLRQTSEVGDVVRTPDNSQDSFNRLKNRQEYSDKKTGFIMQRSYTNHSHTPDGEFKAGIKPGEMPRSNAKVTITAGPNGGQIIKRDER